MDEYELLTIEVTGIDNDITKDALENFFAVSRRGGDITQLDFVPGSERAFITFAREEGAKTALDTSPHFLKNCELSLRKKKKETWENDKVYVENISIKTTEDSLELYMERISDGCGVRNITYGNRSSQSYNAIVTFESAIGFAKIHEGFKKKRTLEERAISIKPVPYCNTILVKNLPATATNDSVLNKFESRRAGGDEVARVDLDMEKRIALVEFKNPSVIDEVLSREQTLDKTILAVERYFPILGKLDDLQSKTSNPATILKEALKPPESTTFTTELDSDLYFYLKENHPANLNFALQEPPPNIEVKAESVHFSFSTQDAKEHFQIFLKDYKCEFIPFNPVLLEHGLGEEIERISQIFKTGNSVVFIDKYAEGFIKLVGRAVRQFDHASNSVNERIREVNKTYEEKNNRRENTLELLPAHVKLLQRSTRFQRVVDSLKKDGFQIQLNDATGKINMAGSLTHLNKFANEIQDILGRFDERSLNQRKFSILKSDKGIAHIKALLNKKLTVEVIVNERDVMLYGLDKSQVDQAYDAVVNAISEVKLPQSLRTKSAQEAFLTDLGSSIPIAFDTEAGDQARIICFTEHMRKLSGKVEDFKERKKTVEKNLPLRKVVLRFLEVHGKTLLDGLRMSSPGLIIKLGPDTLLVSGEKLLVEKCCASIQLFIKVLKFENMEYGTPETSSSITGMTAKAAINNIERKHQCAIVVTTKERIDRRTSFSTTPANPTFNYNEEMKRTKQCCYTYPNGKVIEVHQGDILNHPVHYLVNSANDEMKHSGGLARAIVEKGGSKIQTDCHRALSDLGESKLFPGDVVTTDGGNLLCKKVLHVVVPKYSPTASGRNIDEEAIAFYLREACLNVLKHATDGNTIAIPVLGTGIYNVPHVISAKSLIATAHEFFGENPSHDLKEIHFVDNDPNAVEALMNEMLARFGNDSNLQINELVRDRWVPYTSRTTVVSTSAIVSGDMVFHTQGGMEIRLTVGNIAKAMEDVIVNTVANDLNLTKNPCSKAILAEAGNAITGYCEQWVKKNGQLNEGTFAITDSAKLKCKKVFHVSCPSWSADNGEKKLREIVQKILAEVQKLSLTSIAIPALGTGTLHFPEQLVAKVLFEEAMKFSSKHSSSLKVKKFNIVVYDGNQKAVTTFKEQYQVFSNKKLDTTIKKTKRKSRSPFVSKPKVKERSEEDETYGVNVEIVQGNIVNESTQAIGLLVAEDITKGGQIGTALLKAAGPSLVQEYSTLGKIKAGTVVMTSGGNLKAPCLLHMVIKDTIITFEKSMIRDAVKNCLNHADSCGIISLSLPAVGTGTLKKDAKQSAEILYGCIKEYRKREIRSLKLIRIVILDEKLFADFNAAFSRKDPTTDCSGTALRTKLQIVLEIAAESSVAFATIKEELREIEKERSLWKTIDAAQRLDARQLADIHEVEDLHHVHIDCKPEIGCIRVNGLAENVADACQEIQRKLLVWKQEKHDMDACTREVQWFFYEEEQNNAVIPDKYSDSQSAKIEKAYRKNEASVVVGEDMKFKIDFATMTETNLDTNEKMKVYRRPCEAFPLPQSWEYQPVDSSTGKELKVHSVTLSKSEHNREIDKVHDMIKATLPNAEIVNIERIQNPRLFQIYEGQKKKMSDGGNEKQLFHGTAKTAVQNINSTGFNRAYCGRNAVKFGKGVYFATRAIYSAQKQYSTPDNNGLKYMYIARVLVGKFTKGKEGLLVPPPIDETTSDNCYDSVVDDVALPTMYVIFYDYQSYPEYLVTFKNP